MDITLFHEDFMKERDDFMKECDVKIMYYIRSI